MNKSNYNNTFNIDYQGLNQHLETPLPKLMTYLQETAIRHSEDIGFTMQYFFEQMTGWVILGWNIEILSVPKWLDDITVYTAPASFKGFFAHRGFEIHDKDDNVLLRAGAQWIYTSRQTRKPIRAPEDMPPKYGELLPLPVEANFKLPKLIDFEEFYSKTIKITRRDIDTNLHVNNISYIEWAMDSIPEDVYNNMRVSKSKINYKKECTINQEVTLKTYRKDNNFITNILDDEEHILTEIYTEWVNQ